MDGEKERERQPERERKSGQSKALAANNRSGFWIMAVIIIGATYVAISPFLGVLLQVKAPTNANTNMNTPVNTNTHP